MGSPNHEACRQVEGPLPSSSQPPKDVGVFPPDELPSVTTTLETQFSSCAVALQCVFAHRPLSCDP